MARAGLVVWVLVAGCGRLGFATFGDRDAAMRDSAVADVAADAFALPASCVGLPATCGPAGTAPCCSSPDVVGGSYYRSYDLGTDDMFPDMSSPATVSDLRFDTYLVTVGRFRQFVDAGMGTQVSPPSAGAGAHAQIANSGWDASWDADLDADMATLVSELPCDPNASWTATPGANETLPIDCITWYEAMAFCAWDGGFLPTEAEWNYVAAGGSDQRAYPWASPPSSLTIDCTYANFEPDAAFCVDPMTNGAPNPVGSESPIGDGRWGQSDLAGDVSEWVLDWFASPYPTPCDNCAQLAAGMYRVVRGGSFTSVAANLRTGSRGFPTPSQRNVATGVRCARAP